MTKVLGNIVAICMITIGFGTLMQVQAFARLKGDDARRLPIGERQYVIDSDSRYAPVEIQPSNSLGDDRKPSSNQNTGSSRKILRDPVRPGEESKTEDRQVRRKVAPKVEYKVVKGPARAKQLRFSKMAVNGKMVEPRVKFERPSLSVGRVEEPTKAQFFQKISEATNDW